jgi:hypothetical protein
MTAPYDIVFAQPRFEDEIFPSISAESEQHAMDTRNTDEFLQLPSTNSLLEDLAPANGDQSTPVPAIASLAFHGYHYWRHGRSSSAVDEATLRALLAPGANAIGTWTIAAPDAAGYVTLPPHLVWAKTEQGAPEPVHGFFYTVTPHPGLGQIHFLVALGVRPERAGITAIEISVSKPVFPPGHFGDLDARDDGDDFANVLPGGEMRGLLAVTNAGEVLKLISRVLHHLQGPQSPQNLQKQSP